MKVTVTITTQEAIEAWKQLNPEIKADKVEIIEEVASRLDVMNTLNMGSSDEKCLNCGKERNPNLIHACSFYTNNC